MSGTVAAAWDGGANIYHSWTADNANAIMVNISQNAVDAGLAAKANTPNTFTGTQTMSGATGLTTAQARNIVAGTEAPVTLTTGTIFLVYDE